MTRGLTRVHNRCSLARGIARTHFSEQHSVIRLVDTLLFDEFDWLIVLWRTWFMGFSGQPKSDAPYLGQFLSGFVRVKSNVSPRPSPFTYPIFEKSNFWPNYPFKNIEIRPIFTGTYRKRLQRVWSEMLRKSKIMFENRSNQTQIWLI